MAVAGVQAVSVFNHAQNDGIRLRPRASSIVQMWRELEDEYLSSSGRERPNDILSRMNSRETNGGTTSSEEREWQQSEETASRSRREWLGEMEQERVRVIREWVHLMSQRREPAGRTEPVLDGLGGSRKGIQRLWGRQALLDLLKKNESERRFEIAQLLERRAVSQFPHRLRIQAVLRGRFLRTCDDGSTSRRNSAADRWVVSKSGNFNVEKEIRKDIALLDVCVDNAALSTAFAKFDSAVASNNEIEDGCRLEGKEIPAGNSQKSRRPLRPLLAEDDTPENEIREDESANSCRTLNPHFSVPRMNDCYRQKVSESSEYTNAEQYSSSPHDTRTDTSSEKGSNLSENWCQDRPADTFEFRQGVSETSQNTENGEDSAENPYPMSDHYFLSIIPTNACNLLTGDRANTSEIEELLTRRSVSSALGSDFSRSLNELLRAQIQRQSSASAAEYEAGSPEWDEIGELKMEMGRLRQQMNSMQRMVEACMEMQLNLQEPDCREVLSAGRWPESDRNFDCVRRGMCCVCHSSSIDSLLYRCGHWCTCVSCGNELVSSAGKCPMCCAPVSEVFQSYIS